MSFSERRVRSIFRRSESAVNDGLFLFFKRKVSSLLSSLTVLVVCRTSPVITSSYLEYKWHHLGFIFILPSASFFAPVPPPWFSFYNVWLDDFQTFKQILILKQEAAVLFALKCVLKWTGVI